MEENFCTQKVRHVTKQRAKARQAPVRLTGQPAGFNATVMPALPRSCQNPGEIASEEMHAFAFLPSLTLALTLTLLHLINEPGYI